MGAGNCYKRPFEIDSDNLKIFNQEGSRINVLIQDSFPQDTCKSYLNPEEEKAQQEVSNQKLYQQEGSPK